MRQNFMEWFTALIRRDIKDYQEDPRKKKILYGKIKGKSKEEES